MRNELSQLPVQGNSVVEILTHDHQVIKDLLAELDVAKEFDERKSVLEDLKAALTLHNATEEILVYPALEKVAGEKTEAQHLYHETAEADVLMFELDAMLKEGVEENFKSKATNLQKVILEHMGDEERSAFVHLEEQSDGLHSKLLTEAVREFRSALRFLPASA